ncbi:protein kinase domain-containing protein [Sorangium sp. So ce854]|uniref:protein kinase domain-containing protein n=1 Tax=Sorangium sp. So ce854 TaxID=3133322 RepID=UPI003F60E72C
MARRVAEALGAAHARGIVHRDVKPANLFLVHGRPDQVKVLDFGVVRLQSAYFGATRPGPSSAAAGPGGTTPELVTRTLRPAGTIVGTLRPAGTIVGTPGYMAPEQARGEASVDARADVFALGLVLYRCLTGRPAFAAEHPIALLVKLVFEEPPRISELRPDLPPALDALVRRMIAKDREARPADGEAAALALAALEHVGPGHEASGHAAPGHAAPGHAVPGHAAPGHAAPGHAGPGHAAPGHAGPGHAALAPATDAASGLATDAAPGSAAGPAAPAPEGLTRGEREAIDRAAALLVVDPGAGEPGILLDDVTAALLDARFEVRAGGAVRRLVAEHAPAVEPASAAPLPATPVDDERSLETVAILMASACFAAEGGSGFCPLGVFRRGHRHPHRHFRSCRSIRSRLRVRSRRRYRCSLHCLPSRHPFRGSSRCPENTPRGLRPRGTPTSSDGLKRALRSPCGGTAGEEGRPMSADPARSPSFALR